MTSTGPCPPGPGGWFGGDGDLLGGAYAPLPDFSDPIGPISLFDQGRKAKLRL